MLHAFDSDWEPAPRPAPAGTVLLAIGDVHGHREHLDALLDLLASEIAAADGEGRVVELVTIGDYIDRGPDSLGVLRRVAALGHEPGFRLHALRGNHDQYLIDVMLAPEPSQEALEAWWANGGGTTLAELGITDEDIVARELIDLAAQARDACGDALVEFLAGLELRWDAGDYAFVHAGIHPYRPLPLQGPREFVWLREPFLSAPTWPYPFTVVHGHTIRGPEVRPHRIAIDSGVYRTGVLTALQLVEDRLRFWCVTSDATCELFHALPGLRQPRRFNPPRPLPPPTRPA